VSVSVGPFQSCAILMDSGAVACWGANLSGELGPSISSVLSAVTLRGLINVVSVAVGSLHGCAVRADGTAWCWGRNDSGQLGNGSPPTAAAAVPVQVSGITGAVSVVAGRSHTCALLAGGTVKCWGVNDRGQLGNGTITASSGVPVGTAPISSKA